MPLSILIFLLIIILILIICSIIINSLPFNNNILGGQKGDISPNEFTRMLDFLKEDDELYNKTTKAWIVEYTDDKLPPNIQKRINNFTLQWLGGYYLRSQVPNLYKDLEIGTKNGVKTNGNKKEKIQVNGLYNNIIKFIKSSKIGNEVEANNIKSRMNAIFSKYKQTNKTDNETVDKEILGSYTAEILGSYNEAEEERRKKEEKKEADRATEWAYADKLANDKNKELAYQLQAKTDYDNRGKGWLRWGAEDSLDIDDPEDSLDTPKDSLDTPKDKQNRDKLKLALARGKNIDSINSTDSSISTDSLAKQHQKLLIENDIKKRYEKFRAEKRQKSEDEENLMAEKREKSLKMLSDYQNGAKLGPEFDKWEKDEKNKKVQKMADEWQQKRIDAERKNAREQYNNLKKFSDATKKEQRVKSINDIKTEIVSKKYNINLNKTYNKKAIDNIEV
uniref:Uncharacterized protein n=1 Tax=viral metagenome TaxID=1070528 RepID=A0A6C0I138_9ZZZZ